jgi:hypothetical protein
VTGAVSSVQESFARNFYILSPITEVPDSATNSSHLKKLRGLEVADEWGTITERASPSYPLASRQAQGTHKTVRAQCEQPAISTNPRLQIKSMSNSLPSTMNPEETSSAFKLSAPAGVPMEPISTFSLLSSSELLARSTLSSLNNINLSCSGHSQGADPIAAEASLSVKTGSASSNDGHLLEVLQHHPLSICKIGVSCLN